MQLNPAAPIAHSSRFGAARAEAEAACRLRAQAVDRQVQPATTPPVGSFRVDWALSNSEIREAQRLRFKVFAGEMGARLAQRDPRDHRDADAFDAFCDHLIVRCTGGSQEGEVVATCRVLSPEGAGRVGSRYAETEFDLAPVRDLLSRSLEMGRVCVDPTWRNGLLVMALWRELGKRMEAQHLDTLIGCSSVSLRDGGDAAEQLWHLLKRTHLVAPQWRVRPWVALTLQAQDAGQPVLVPALIKAYLRCGGKLLGPPAIDTAFNTADFPMLMHLGDLPSRYSKRIFGASA